jgi:Kef-type K+ transport system membrane component KefB
MDSHQIVQMLGVLAVLLAAARLLGAAARWIGQPAVLGELLAGVLLGASVLGVIDPSNHGRPGTIVLEFLAELGVVLLLFEIGLETDLMKLLRAGPTATAVAIVGVVLPFAAGYGVCRLFHEPRLVCVVAGAALTATSVGITARVLNDLGRLQEPESQIVLGAAVIDDVLGLIILTIVSGIAAGKELTVASVAGITGLAFGFLVVAIVAGSFIVPPLVRWLDHHAIPGMLTTVALLLAFGLAFSAEMAGSASIIGAFVAGLLLGRTPQAHNIEKAVQPLGHFFVPLFFVFVGASVDVHTFVPRDAGGWTILGLGASLIAVAVLGKFAAGYAPFWFRGRKAVIGVGMVPRGEVGLIFAQMGLTSKVAGEPIFSQGLFTAVTLMVMVTTFLAPPLLRVLFPPVETEPRDQAAGSPTDRNAEGTCCKFSSVDPSLPTGE